MVILGALKRLQLVPRPSGLAADPTSRINGTGMVQKIGQRESKAKLTHKNLLLIASGSQQGSLWERIGKRWRHVWIVKIDRLGSRICVRRCPSVRRKRL